MNLRMSGSGSVAAINACGINQKEAMAHFSAALEVEQDYDLRRVREAANFCVQEFNEVDQWRGIVREIKEEDLEGSGKRDSSAHSTSVENVARTQGLSIVFAPIRLIKSATHLLVRSLFTLVGICSQNLLEMKDHVGLLGVVTRCMKNVCADPSSRDVATPLSSPVEDMMKVRLSSVFVQ